MKTLRQVDEGKTKQAYKDLYPFAPAAVHEDDDDDDDDQRTTATTTTTKTTSYRSRQVRAKINYFTS